MTDEPVKRGPGRPRTRDKMAELRRQEPLTSLPPVARNILDASRRILEREGFAALSLQAIAEEADESKGSIGYYFGNKNGLLVALVDSLVHEANRELIVDAQQHPMGDQRLRTLVTGERDIIADTPGFIMLLEILPHALREDSLRERVANLYSGYRQTVRDAVNGTAKTDPSIRHFGTLMIAMVDGLSVQYALDPDGFDLDGAIALWERMIRSLFSDMGVVDMG